MATPTLRTLARELGLSRTTVSDALRGSPRVKPETVERVRAAAKAAGYDRNPLAGAVMSFLRRSCGQKFRGVLGVLEIVAEEQSPNARRYNDAVFEGVSNKAEQLGFKVDRFQLGATGLKLSRLDSILQTRGINGLIVLPAAGFPDLTGLSWSRYTAVYVDYFVDSPPMHCVCSDHYRSMIGLLRELHARGFRRPGLFIETSLDERLHFRWEGAFLALQHYLPDIDKVPILRPEHVTFETFQPWFEKYQPDVVLGHFPDAVGWMKRCGARIPRVQSFVCLNSLRTDGACAAMDFQAPQLGARATELVTGHLMHSEFGIPAQASLTTIPARLVEGPTLRARGADGGKPAAARRRTASAAS
ncbi:LacI family DNA-binding transcriptional regulator [Oleiharenicola sp. Vm1]|uniref:LacI family DNA-binding transcriptional regulator n=1 Tax=Oleiharenicola sp. Vm1 TaxID=3398393 RepID=UPI0039F4DE56